MIDFFTGVMAALAFLLAGAGLGSDEAGEALHVWLSLTCLGALGLWLLT